MFYSKPWTQNPLFGTNFYVIGILYTILCMTIVIVIGFGIAEGTLPEKKKSKYFLVIKIF